MRRPASSQTVYTWRDIRAKFESANPTLRAGQFNIDEARAQEITAYLRPNPDLTFAADQFNPHAAPAAPAQLQPDRWNQLSP